NKIYFRLKVNSNDDQPQHEVDTYVTPITPTCQPGTFGAIEPTMAEVSSDFIIPQSEYKWNQIIELQLPDGKKMIVDRTTWVTNPADKTPTIYRLDTQLLIPLSPMGRTGVRGRGAS
ncbi:unnamed protein product, partial [Adineta steineri]